VTRTLHIDCFSGISGDMMLGALLDVGVPEVIVQESLQSLELPGRLVVERVRKSGFAAVKIHVETPHEHPHRHLSDIRRILDRGRLTPGARQIADKMFVRLGQAEAESHGIPIERVHFHEVGAVDSIFDFVGIATAIDWLKPTWISSTPVPTGQGWVNCEHGKLPIPAPAVARLLAGVPLANCPIDAELTTPTGAAVIATLVNEFTRQPKLVIEKVGTGAGTRDLVEQPNVLRLMLGSTTEKHSPDESCDVIWQLETNIDDVPAEIIGYVTERLFDIGALDVYLTPIQMKKNRPAVLLAVLCEDEARAAIEKMIFEETGTLGIRRRQMERTKLERQAVQVQTAWGPVAGKVAWNDEMKVFTPEFEDCARVARQENVPLRTIFEAARRAFDFPDEPEM
jgi:uncharacterized protein (TIGR00299 family) protein